MKFVAVAALAASVVGAAPTIIEDLLELTTEQVSDFEVVGLGGMTLRAEQQYNENFIAAGRGPRSYLKSLAKYSAFGATIDPELLCIVDGILQELGLGALAGATSSQCASLLGGAGGVNGGRPGSGTGTGTGSGSGSGTGTRPTGRPTNRPTATGSGARPTATGSGARPGNATGNGQGM